jgi:hypothetical protein
MKWRRQLNEHMEHAVAQCEHQDKSKARKRLTIAECDECDEESSDSEDVSSAV